MKDKNPKRSMFTRSFVLLLALVVLMTSCGPATQPLTGDQISGFRATYAAGRPTPVPTKTRTPNPTPVRADDLDVDEADLEGVVVRVVHPWAGEMADTMENIAQQFSATNEWGIQVEMAPMGSESMLKNSLEEDIDNQTLPGIVIVHHYLLEDFSSEFMNVSVLYYLLNEKWGFSSEEKTDSLYVLLNSFMAEKHMHAMQLAPQAALLFYNQTWMQELGYEVLPDNATDLQKMLCDAAYENNTDSLEQNDGTGGWLINLDLPVLLSWYFAHNEYTNTVSIGKAGKMNTEGAQEAFSYLEDLRMNGCAWESINPDPYEYFVNRETIMFSGDTSQIPELQNWMESSGSEDVWAVAPYVGTMESPVLVDGPAMLMVRTTYETQLASWIFVKYLLSPEVQAELVRSSYAIPMRISALDFLDDFIKENPHWFQAYQYAVDSRPIPWLGNWGIKKDLLQDAIYLLLQPDLDDTINIEDLLEQVDSMTDQLREATP